jgi:hypothetical protein
MSVHHLAHGPFSARPALAITLILLLFGLAGAIAPEIPPLP